MKVATFNTEDQRQKHFWKTLRANVQEWFNNNACSTKGNTAMVVKSATMLLLYVAPMIILFFVPLWPVLAVLLVATCGVGKAGIGMSVMHDGLHGAYSRKKWANALAGASMYIIGSNVFNWKIQHNVFHHAYTNIHGLDEDIQSRWILRFCEHTPLKPIHRYQHIYAFFLYGLMTLSMLFGDIKQLIAYNRSGLTAKHNAKPRAELIKALAVKALYLMLIAGIPIIYGPYNFWQVLAGFLLMHLVAGFILTIVFQMAHIIEGVSQPVLAEPGNTLNNWAVHQVLTTCDFARSNRLLNWYIGGLNFQVEHHLFPNICHIHYRHIAPIVEKTAAEFGIAYQQKATLRQALASHYRKLKSLGREPTFEPEPALLAQTPLFTYKEKQ